MWQHPHSSAECHSKAIHIVTKLMPAGMKIRFANLIKGLRQLGDDVMVVTPCINPPKTFHGAKVWQHSAHVPSICLVTRLLVLHRPNHSSFPGRVSSSVSNHPEHTCLPAQSPQHPSPGSDI